MGLYGDKKDYEELVKDNISKAKILYSLSEENRILVNNLLNEKEKIKEKNGLFANLQLRIIDKKIEKIKKSNNKTINSNSKSQSENTITDTSESNENSDN